MLVFSGAACSGREPTLEERAHALDRQIICPVCPGETLDQSQVQIARDMRAIIRERLAAGDSEAAIKQFFVDRYGRRILAEPPASGISLAVWIVPPIAFLIGGGLLFLVVRQMRRPVAQVSRPAVDRYLDEVDSELGSEMEDGRTARPAAGRKEN